MAGPATLPKQPNRVTRKLTQRQRLIVQDALYSWWCGNHSSVFGDLIGALCKAELVNEAAEQALQQAYAELNELVESWSHRILIAAGVDAADLWLQSGPATDKQLKAIQWELSLEQPLAGKINQTQARVLLEVLNCHKTATNNLKRKRA